jgi:uncharacterized membrane protein YcgQ (UPF0703/DUF1980 family)
MLILASNLRCASNNKTSITIMSYMYLCYVTMLRRFILWIIKGNFARSKLLEHCQSHQTVAFKVW